MKFLPILFLLLTLTPNQQPTMEKDKKLSQDLGRIQQWLIEKNNELNGFIDWDINNPNVLGGSELQSVKNAQEDIRAIDARIIQISTKKSLGLSPLVLEQKAIPTTPIEEEKPMPNVEYSMAGKGGPGAEVIVTVLEEEDMNPATFEDKIMGWLGSLLLALDAISTKNDPRTEIEVDLMKLANNRKKVVEYVMKQLQSELTNSEESTVGAITAKLRTKVSALSADKTWILKEYNANKGNGKEQYKQLEDLSLPTGLEFVTRIKRPADVVEAERVAKAEEDTLITHLQAWREAEVQNILTATTKFFYDFIDEQQLIDNANELTCNEGFEAIRDEIKMDVLGLLKGKKEMQVLAFRDSILNIVRSYLNEDDKFYNLRDNYFPNKKRPFQMPTGFKEWIEKSIKPSGVRGFIEAFDVWKGKA